MDFVRSLFVLGPSGSGKSSFATWLKEQHGWYHLELDHRSTPEESTIEAEGLLRAWESFSRHLDARALASTLCARSLEAGFPGAVVSFSSTRLLPVAYIEELASKGIHSVILFGSVAECCQAFLSREAARSDGLDATHWGRFNDKVFESYAADAYAPYRVSSFRAGGRRPWDSVLAEVVARALSSERDAAVFALTQESRRLVDTQAELALLRQQLSGQASEFNRLKQERDQLSECVQFLQLCNEIHQRSIVELELFPRRVEDQSVAIAQLQKELQAERECSARLRDSLESRHASEALLKREQAALSAERLCFQDEVKAHAKEMRELDVLRVECSRRFQVLRETERCRDTLQNQIKALEASLSQASAREAELVERQRQLERLHVVELDTIRSQLAQPQSSAPADEVRRLQCLLADSQQETQALLTQLFEIQEELERYCFLAQGQVDAPSLLPSRPFQASMPDPGAPHRHPDPINTNRARLLSQV